MPSTGQPGTAAPELSTFGPGAKEFEKNSVQSRIQAIEMEGQPTPTPAPESEGKGEKATSEPSPPAPEQVTQEHETDDNWKKRYSDSSREAKRLAERLAILERQLKETQEPAKDAQRILQEKLANDPSFWDDPGNQAQFTQRQINETLSKVIPEMEYKRHFEDEAKRVLGDKISIADFNEPIPLPNGNVSTKYNLAREYLTLTGQPNANPLLALHSFEHTGDLKTALDEARVDGARTAVQRATDSARRGPEKPGRSNPPGRKPETTAAELFRHGRESGDFGPFLKDHLARQGEGQ